MARFEFNSDDERDAAEDRIRRIRGQGQGQEPEPAPPPRDPYYDEPLDDDPPAISRARERARAAREALARQGGLDEPPAPPSRVTGTVPVPPAAPVPREAARSRQAFLIIGGLVVLGVLIVVFLAILSSFMPGGGIFGPPVPTVTPSPTPTETPTPTPEPTPTVPAPNLSLPPLTCIFQSGVGCFDYCQNPDNQSECESARSFIRAQGANPDVFFQCIAPGPGPNQGNAQDCLEEAWRANQ